MTVTHGLPSRHPPLPGKFFTMSTTTHYCPLDGAPMTERPHGRESFHQCWECSGIWASRLLLFGLCHRRDPTLVGSLAELPPPVHRTSPIHCPGCNYLMAQRILHDIQVDVCPECRAIWLDGGEIIHIGRKLQAREKANNQQLRHESKNVVMRSIGMGHLDEGKARVWSLSGGILDATAALIGELLD